MTYIEYLHRMHVTVNPLKKEFHEITEMMVQYAILNILEIL